MASRASLRSFRKLVWIIGAAFGASVAFSSHLACAAMGPIGVQFVQAGPQLSATQIAGVVPQDDFNPVFINNSVGTTGTTGVLIDAFGNPTGITLTHVSGDGYNSNVGASTPNGILLHGEDKTGPSGRTLSNNPGLTATYTFNNVPAANYNLIAYIENDWAGVNANITAGGTTYYLTDEAVGGVPDAGSFPVPQFLSANNTNPATRVIGNYVEFDGIVPSAGSITLTNTAEGGANDTAAIDGFQLIVTPEPSSALLLGTGILTLNTTRRAKRRVAHP